MWDVGQWPGYQVWRAGGGEGDTDYNLSVLLTELLGLAIILFNVLVTFMLSALERWAYEKHKYIQIILKVLYRELMILGCIALVVLVVESQVHLAPDVLLAFEAAHVLLFMLAVFFSVSVITSAYMSLKLSSTWIKMEHIEYKEYEDMRVEYDLYDDKRKSKDSWLWRHFLWAEGKLSKIRRHRKLAEIMSFHDIRFQFIFFRKLPENFAFSRFLRKVKAHVFVEIVEIHWTHWLSCLVFVGFDSLRRWLFDVGNVSSNVQNWYDFWLRVCIDLAAISSITLLYLKIRKSFVLLISDPETYFDDGYSFTLFPVDVEYDRRLSKGNPASGEKHGDQEVTAKANGGGAKGDSDGNDEDSEMLDEVAKLSNMNLMSQPVEPAPQEKGGSHEDPENSEKVPTAPTRSPVSGRSSASQRSPSKRSRGHSRAPSKTPDDSIFDSLFTEDHHRHPKSRESGTKNEESNGTRVQGRYSVDTEQRTRARAELRNMRDTESSGPRRASVGAPVDTHAKKSSEGGNRGVGEQKADSGFEPAQNHRLANLQNLDFGARDHQVLTTTTLQYKQEGRRVSASSHTSGSSGRPSIEVAGRLPFEKLQMREEERMRNLQMSQRSREMHREDILDRFMLIQMQNEENEESARFAFFRRLFPFLVARTQFAKQFFWLGNPALYLWLVGMISLAVVFDVSISIVHVMFAENDSPVQQWVPFALSFASLIYVQIMVSHCMTKYVFVLTVTCLVDESLVEELVDSVIENTLDLHYEASSRGGSSRPSISSQDEMSFELQQDYFSDDFGASRSARRRNRILQSMGTGLGKNKHGLSEGGREESEDLRHGQRMSKMSDASAISMRPRFVHRPVRRAHASPHPHRPPVSQKHDAAGEAKDQDQNQDRNREEEQKLTQGHADDKIHVEVREA
ncbi:hypothetical protein FVE85_2091 [Porphyridium purpureum]|uniref:Uncharacterized protein n=1 Tax=Porphyridium purpureum TaxID=35688 RepID=A0A5J4YX65_PORPP|nr:hypothetical protein FVE85_2091 [Porphyridium purpureum]|eukprot:POR6479..scf209_3